MQVFTCLSHRNRIPFDATSSLLDQNEGQGPSSGAIAPPSGASPSSISTHQRLSAVAPAYIYMYKRISCIHHRHLPTKDHNPRFAECAELAARSAFSLVICGALVRKGTWGCPVMN